MTSEPEGVVRQLLNGERLRAWLAERLPIEGELGVRRISHGHSNEMFELAADSGHWVLRRPSRGASAAQLRTLARERRLLEVLAGTDVPHARLVARCDDEDVIGAPFTVSEWVDGFSGHPPLPDPFSGGPGIAELAFDLVDVLLRIAAVDWHGVGLAEFGRPQSFHDRQVRRWSNQLGSYAIRQLPRYEEVASWLVARQPLSFEPGLMHGDYGPRNVMFGRARPGHVAAVIDWEQSTIGDPLLDLGWMTAMWEQAGDDIRGRDPSVRFSELEGAPQRRTLVERYAAASDRRVDALPYYQVLALFKLASVMEGSYVRYTRGQSDDPYHATLETRVPALIRRAHDITRGAGWS